MSEEVARANLAMTADRYYLRYRGRVTGPYDLARIGVMAERGSLSRLHEVSVDGRSWTSAGSMPGLFSGRAKRPAASGDAKADSGGLGPALREIEPVSPEETSPPCKALAGEGEAGAGAGADEGACTRRLIRRLAFGTGLAAAPVLLLCAFLPHGRVGGELVWWWDPQPGPGTVPLGLACVYGILAAVGLAVAPFRLEGTPRGRVYVAVGAAGVVVLLAASACFAGLGRAVLAGLAVPVLCAGLGAVTWLRSSEGANDPAGRRQAAFATVVLSCTPAAGLAVAYGLATCGGSASAWKVVAAVLAAIGHVAALVCGVLAVSGARPTLFGSRRGTAMTIATALGVTAPGIAGLALAFAIASSLGLATSGARFAVLQVLRLEVATYVLAAVLAAGIGELWIEDTHDHDRSD